jgi:hypothetical protein
MLLIGGIGLIFEDDGSLTVKGTYEEVVFTFIADMQGSVTVDDRIHIHTAKKIFEWIGADNDKPAEFDELKVVFDRVYELAAFS